MCHPFFAPLKRPGTGAALLASLVLASSGCTDDATSTATTDGAGSPAEDVEGGVDASSDAQPEDAAAGETQESDDTSVAPALTVSPLPGSAPAGSTVDVAVQVVGLGAGATVEGAVTAGGGSVTPATTDAEGRATLRWTLGVVPVAQALTVQVGELSEPVAMDATREEALTAQPFGEVAEFFETQKLAGSTEDLVFTADGLVMGAPDGLLLVQPSGAVARLPLTGAPPAKGWGVASHPDGALWVVDLGGQRLVRVAPGGEAKTVLSADGETPFDGLNDVEVAPDERVYATDPCLGVVVRVDADGTAQTGSLTFDRATQGGPNGLAFDAQGRLYLSTENTVLLCQQTVADYDAPLAGVFRTTPTADGFGPLEPVQAGIGVFGDGLAFDAEGNLYGIFTSVAGVGIGENAVWVLPGGEGPARRVVVAPPETLYANVAFGRGDFGDTQLYLSLLSAAPFTGPASIGLHRVEVGLRGAPR